MGNSISKKPCIVDPTKNIQLIDHCYQLATVFELVYLRNKLECFFTEANLDTPADTLMSRCGRILTFVDNESLFHIHCIDAEALRLFETVGKLIFDDPIDDYECDVSSDATAQNSLAFRSYIKSRNEFIKDNLCDTAASINWTIILSEFGTWVGVIDALKKFAKKHPCIETWGPVLFSDNRRVTTCTSASDFVELLSIRDLIQWIDFKLLLKILGVRGKIVWDNFNGLLLTSDLIFWAKTHRAIAEKKAEAKVSAASGIVGGATSA